MPGPPELAGPALGETVGPYRLEAVLGEGAMGIVYRAVREPEGTIVALKLLRRELSTDDTYRRRFAREGRIASGLEHRHLVPVLEAGEAGGRPYLVSDYVEGRTLANLLELDGPLPLSALLRVVAEIATGLDTLHREGLVHRDVKPSNIIVASTGTTFLTDFGLAKGAAATVLTKPGRVVGTLEYLAPEVIRGSPAGPAADIYSLGCVAFECIAGRPPLIGPGFVETTLAILENEPSDPCASRPDFPSGFSEVVLQALAKQPSDRPPTAAAYALMLRISARAA